MLISNTLGSGVETFATGVCGVVVLFIDDESAAVFDDAAPFGVSFTDDFVEFTGLSIDVSVSSDKPLIFSTAFAKFARLSDDVSLPAFRMGGAKQTKNNQLKFIQNENAHSQS